MNLTRYIRDTVGPPWRFSSFLARNLFHCRAFAPIAPSSFNEFELFGLDSKNYSSALELYRATKSDHNVAMRIRALYQVLGRKLCLVARVKGKSRVIGINAFYLRPEHHSQRSIEEGFLGVHLSARGTGLAKALKSAALDHFFRNGVDFTYCSIDKDNLPSVRLQEAVGGIVVDEFSEPVGGTAVSRLRFRTPTNRRL